jgi:hypothetical protein
MAPPNASSNNDRKEKTTMRSSLACRLFQGFGLIMTVFLALASTTAQAVPAFARQTGFRCEQCHVAFPELTPFGRQFKLTGYTLGERQTVPLAAMGLFSRSTIRNNHQDDGSGFPKNGKLLFEGGSVFAAGKISDHMGGFVQWTFDTLSGNDDGSFSGHSSIDNVDVRYADHYAKGDTDLIWGVTVHNAPTVQDVWNTIPAWSYPYQGPKVANNGSGPASTFIESGARVAGFGAYGFLNNMFYGEFSLYRSANGALSALRAGNTPNPGDAIALSGYNPYLRLVFNKQWNEHVLSLGYFGMVAKQYPDSTNISGPTDRFVDHGFDAQYQYLSGAHTVSTQLSYVREKATWNAGFANGSVDNPSSHLKSFKAKASYYYQRKYGATLGYFASTGDADCARFCLKDENGVPEVDANGQVIGAHPNTSGFMYELSYTPIQYVRLAAQYTAFGKFNGASSNYNGAGRNPKDNNTLYLYAWVAY